MSNTVDNRVVNMQFNNQQFEAGVKQSMSSLEKLKASLDFTGAEKGLSNVQNSVNNLSFSAIESSIASLEQRFSTLGIVGMTAIQNITNKVINLGTQIGTSLFNQMKTGGVTRYQNIANAKFQIEGLGKDWDELYKSMDEAVSGTAYGIDEAAKAASSLSASGIESGEEMTKALKSISGVAAMTNSTYSDIADVFTTVASNGKLMTMQLRQLSSRGLNVAAQIAKVKNTTEADVMSMVSKGEISFMDFAEAMTDFGEHAKEANNTFSGALSNMKASLSRIGENFARPVYERLIGPLNDLRGLFDKVKGKLLEFTGSLTGGDWFKSPFGKFIGALSNKIRILIRNIDLDWMDTFVDYMIEAANAGTYFITHYHGVIETIKDYLVETGKVQNESSPIITFLNGLLNIWKTLSNIFNSVSLIIQVVISAFREAFNLGDATDNFYTLTEVLLNLSESMKFTEEDAKKTKPVLVDFFTTVKTVIDKVVTTVEKVSGIISPLFSKIFDYAIKLYELISAFVNKAIEFNNKYNIVGNVMEKIKGLFKSTGSFVEKITSEFSSLFDLLKKITPKQWGFATLLVLIIDFVHRFNTIYWGFRSILFTAQKIQWAANNITSFINNISNVLKGLKYFTKAVSIALVIKEIAIAILILAAAIALLTLVDQSKMENVVKCLAIMVGVMTLFGVAMGLVFSSVKGTLKAVLYVFVLAAAMTSLAVSVFIIAAAIEKLSSIDYESLWNSFKILTGIIIELIAAVALLSLIAPVLTAGTFSLLVIAAAVYILASALNKLGEINSDQLAEKIVAIGLCLLSLVLISKVANVGGLAQAGGLIAMVISLWSIVKIMKYIADEGVDFDTFKKNIDKFIIVLGAFVVLALILDTLAYGATGLTQAALSMIGICAAVYILTLSIKKIASIDSDSLSGAIGALAVIFIGIYALLTVLTSGGVLVKRAGSTILLISVAMIIIAASLTILAKTAHDMGDDLGAALLTMVAMMLTVLAMLIVMSTYVTKVKASSLILVAVLIGIVAASLTLLTRYGNMDRMLEAAGDIGLVLLALAVSLAVISGKAGGMSYMAMLAMYDMVLVLVAISASLLLISTIESDKLLPSVLSLILVLAALSAAIVLISMFEKGVTPSTVGALTTFIASILVIAASLVLLTQFGNMDKVYDAVASIVLILASVTACFIAISWFSGVFTVTDIVAFGVMILSLLVIAASLKLLLDGNYSWSSMWQATVAMIAVFAAVTAGLALLSVISSNPAGLVGMIVAAASLAVVILSLAVAMKTFASLIKTMIDAIKALTAIDYDKIDIEVLTQLLGIMLKMGLISFVVGAGISTLGVGLLIFGAGLTIVTANAAILVALFGNFVMAVNMLVAALMTAGVMSDVIATGIDTIANSISNAIMNAGVAFANGIEMFITTLAAKSYSILTAVKAIVIAVVMTVKDTLVAIIDICVDLIIELLQIVEDKGPILVEVVLNIIKSLLEALATNAEQFAYYGTIIAVSFMFGVIEGIVAMMPYIAEKMKELAYSVSMEFSKAMDNAGTLAADGLKVGMLSGIKATGDFVNELLGTQVIDTTVIQGEMDYQRGILEENWLNDQAEMAEAGVTTYCETIDNKTAELTNANETMVATATDQKDVAAKGMEETANAGVNAYSNTLTGTGGTTASSALSTMLSNVTGGQSFGNFEGLGTNSITSFISGQESQTTVLKKSMEGLSSTAIDAMKADGFKQEGGYLVKEVQAGVDEESNNFSLKNLFTSEGGAQDELLGIFGETSELAGESGTETGGEYINGIIDGVLDSDKLAELSGAGADVAAVLDDSTRDELGIESPSKKGIEIGNFWDLGVAKGITDNVGVISNAATKSSNTIVGAFNKAMSSSKYYDGLYSPNITPVINDDQILSAMSNLDSIFNNQSSLDLATQSAVSVENTSAYMLSQKLDELGLSINKLANTDYSKLLEGVAVNIDNSTTVDGAALRQTSARYTIKQVNNQQQNYAMAIGGRI